MMPQQPNPGIKAPGLLSNGIWGILSSFAQVLFVSAFFVIVARHYTADEFGRFLVSTTVYQLVAAFSSMGLGQWFIRQYASEPNKISFTAQFLKTQAGLGILFYLVNIGLAFILYPDQQIRLLCILLGANIIFDNLITALRNLNIAEARQKQTAMMLVLDGSLKLLAGGVLLAYPFSTQILSGLLIVARLLSLGTFIRLGTNRRISLRSVLTAAVSFADLKKQVIHNWQFIVIGSISIIYWRIGNIIISKALTLTDVSSYEIAFRVFSIFQIIPVVASATIYPQFIKYVKQGDLKTLKQFYAAVFFGGALFSLLSYAFIYSFGPVLIPLAFGSSYPGAGECARQMFLTFLLLPTVLFSANLIVAMGMESKDMWFNVLSLLLCVSFCAFGLFYNKSLAVVNYSILGSFVIFHVCQDILLIRKKIFTYAHCFVFYAAITGFAIAYTLLSPYTNSFLLFGSCLLVAVMAALGYRLRSRQIAGPGAHANLIPA